VQARTGLADEAAGSEHGEMMGDVSRRAAEFVLDGIEKRYGRSQLSDRPREQLARCE
jgi:hypothetical protein